MIKSNHPVICTYKGVKIAGVVIQIKTGRYPIVVKHKNGVHTYKQKEVTILE